MFPLFVHEGSPTRRASPRGTLAIVAATFGTWLLTGCSTLVGNISPVDEKSDDYRTLNLEKADSATWRKLPPDPRLKSDVESAETSDVVFQTRDETAIVSLNSACREIPATEAKIPAVAAELTLGFTGVQDVEENWVEVNGRRAFRKTLTGKLEGRTTRLRIVIFAAENCLYDFSYIAPPERFAAREADFDRFVKSLKLKK